MQLKHEIDGFLKAVKVSDGFWSRLIERNRAATLPHILKQCEAAGHIRNLEIAAGRSTAEYSGGPDRDSDLFKTMEGAAYCLALSPDAGLAARLDDLIAKVAAAQEPDGYLQSHFTALRPNEKYTDLHRSHELYCAGHLMEAAVAHFAATGTRTLLDVATKNADHLVATFGPGRRETVPGHQELELALVRLYKTTQDKRYLDLCRYFVDMRGNPERVRREYAGKPVIESERHPGRNRPPAYRQDHLPATEQREPIGHAVRAGYFYAGMADIAMECSSDAHAIAVDALWNNIVGKHLYLTGGVGTHQHSDEGFGDEYLLPNDTAYCETCGGIALMLFSHRMSLLKGDARYADLIETILYNHMMSCPDVAGCTFHYRNPLMSDGTRKRHPWTEPACCSTNIVRVVPQLGRFIYAVNGDVLYVDQFVSSEADVIVNGAHVRVRQETNYPWDGRIEMVIDPATPHDLALHIRIPGWVDSRPVSSDLYAADDGEAGTVAIAVNDKAIDTACRSNGYCVIRRAWRSGDRVRIDFSMPVRRVRAHDKVEADRGRVALMRGPIVYCLEAVDHAIDLDDIGLADDAILIAEHRPDLLGGVTIIKESNGPLTAVPYYAWNNRESGKMLVWMRKTGATHKPKRRKR